MAEFDLEKQSIIDKKFACPLSLRSCHVSALRWQYTDPSHAQFLNYLSRPFSGTMPITNFVTIFGRLATTVGARCRRLRDPLHLSFAP